MGTVLVNIRPMLSPVDKLTCNKVIKWGYDQGESYNLIDQVTIENIKDLIVGFGLQFTGQPRIDLINVINFLNTLNKYCPPEWYQTVEGCIAHEHIMKDQVCVLKDGGVFPPPPPNPEDIDNEEDCLAMNWYWYNDACHVSPQTPAECKNYSECIRAGWYWYDYACHYTPEPPPPDVQPDDFNNKTDCELAGFHWYNSKCNRYAEEVKPPPLPIPEANMFLVYAGYLDEYLETLGILKVIERGIVILLRNWLLLIGNFLIWLEKRGT